MTRRASKDRHDCPVVEGAGGLISAQWCSETYRPVLEKLGPRMADHTMIRKLSLYATEYRGKRVEVVFTPFDRVLPNAKVLLVGITPGRQQWRLAVDAAARALRDGADLDRVLDAANRTGGFAGPMRNNLITMLDGIGVHRALGLPSCEAKFDGSSDLIDGTSAILHAVFIDGENYTGHRPTFEKIPILRAFVDQVLATNLAMTTDALVVPLGRAAESAVQLAAASAEIDRRRILSGFPHPSGANGGRVQQFAEARSRLTRKVRAWRTRVLA